MNNIYEITGGVSSLTEVPSSLSIISLIRCRVVFKTSYDARQIVIKNLAGSDLLDHKIALRKTKEKHRFISNSSSSLRFTMKAVVGCRDGVTPSLLGITNKF